MRAELQGRTAVKAGRQNGGDTQRRGEEAAVSTLRTLAGGAELSCVEFLPCYTCQVLGTPSLNPQGGALLGEGAQTGR